MGEKLMRQIMKRGKGSELNAYIDRDSTYNLMEDLP
jgi:hypothetical protein